MKPVANRLIAVLLVFVICVSLLPANLVAAVDYSTSSEGYIINWGKRGTAATFLSDNAELFYETWNTSYEELSELSGSTSRDSVPQSELYKKLSSLMKSAHDYETTYAATKDMYQYTDCQDSDPSSISSFYSGKAIGPKWDNGNTWNREHTWPNSKGLEGNDENDIMMLRPTSSSENISRGNKAYGESSGYYNPNNVSGGKYDLRGDVARIMLYVYVRWGNTGNMWGTDGVLESVDVMLKWIQADPVDTWELGRNDSVESITGTRNVFVDYPELAFVLFGRDIPTDMTTPSGKANASTSYAIKAVSSNDAHGTVSITGNTVNAFPKTGYEVAGYTLVSGEATVTRSGNAFTVSASSDCEIRIDFTARAVASVTYMENGAQVDSVDAYVGDSVTLPGNTGTVFAGYSFLGWITGSLEETTVAPAAVYAAGTSYSVEEDVTLYALYSRVDSSTSGSSSVFELYSGVITEGDYIIVYNNGAMKAEVSNKNRMNYSDVQPVDNAIQDPAANLIWTISAVSSTHYTLYNEAAASFAAGTGTKNQAGLLSSVTDYAKWTVSGEETYNFVNVGNFDKGVNYTLRRNEDYGFACYHTTTGGDLTLYKRASGTVYYSTVAVPCEHANTKQIPAVAPSCTESGFTAGVYCEDCASYISGHEKVTALGHSYTAVVTEPTATEKGFTTYTCTICSDSYVGNYTDPTGEEYTVSFVVPEGVDTVADMVGNNRGIILPEAGVPAGDYVYTFAGWAAQGVNNTETAPTLYAAGSNYVAQGNVTLYAIYTYTAGGSGGTGEWKLVTDASALKAGTQILLATSEKGFVAGKLNSQYLMNATASFSGDKSTITQLPAEACVLTLGGTSEAWTFANADGQLLGCTAVKKLAWDNGTTTWTISIENGEATVSSTASANGRFLYNVNSPRFTTYTSNTSSSMLLPQLYAKDQGTGKLYYTSVIGTKCEHTGKTELRNEVKPDYLKDGYSGDLYCLACGELLQKGHTVSNNPFSDVGYNSRFKTAILWAYYEGIVTGKTDTTFAPTAPVTRAQFVALLWRAEGQPQPASNVNPFKDLSPNDRFYIPILWAYHAGITSGKTADTFCPGDTCTRAQVVMFLYRHAGKPEVKNVTNPFTDVSANDRFYEAIMWAYSEGITSGKTETTFDITGLCSREHVVAFLYKYLSE